MDKKGEEMQQQLQQSRELLELAETLAAQAKAERKAQRIESLHGNVVALPSQREVQKVTVVVTRYLLVPIDEAEHYCAIVNKLDDVSAVIQGD